MSWQCARVGDCSAPKSTNGLLEEDVQALGMKCEVGEFGCEKVGEMDEGGE